MCGGWREGCGSGQVPHRPAQGVPQFSQEVNAGPLSSELSVTPGRWAGLRLLTSRRPLSCEPQRPRISWQVTAEGARGRNVDINQVAEVWLANTFSHSVGCLSRLLLPVMRRSLMQPHLSILPLLCGGDGRKQRARHPTAGIISEAGLLTHNM